MLFYYVLLLEAGHSTQSTQTEEAKIDLPLIGEDWGGTLLHCGKPHRMGGIKPPLLKNTIHALRSTPHQHMSQWGWYKWLAFLGQ